VKKKPDHDTRDTEGFDLFADAEAEVISSYSRAQAIEDGILVDMEQEPFQAMSREAGVKVPIAMTATAFHEFVELSEAAKRAGNDIKGRWWDVLWMFTRAVKRNRDSDQILFDFYCVTDRVTPSLVKLKAIIGPGDDPAPVLTFMLPEED
jgi:hypothetical protein